jgi:outer membrane protein TolC
MYSWLNVQLPNPDFTLTDSPATRLLEIGVEAATLQKRMAVGESLPQMAVGATYGVNNLIGDNLRPNGMLFATINLPVTAWWESAHQIRKQELLRQQAQNTRNDLTKKLLLQKIDAYYQLAAAYRLVGVRQEAIRYAEENLTEVKNYFEAGIYSMKDYLEAQTLLQQARNEAVDQWVDYLLKRLRYRQLARPVSHGG